MGPAEYAPEFREPGAGIHLPRHRGPKISMLKDARVAAMRRSTNVQDTVMRPAPHYQAEGLDLSRDPRESDRDSTWAGMRADAFLLVKQDHPPNWHATVPSETRQSTWRQDR